MEIEIEMTTELLIYQRSYKKLHR